MSDETPPPPLRLKPRQRSENETPPAEAPAAAEADDGKLHLKSKLSGDIPDVAPVPSVSPEPAAGERVRIKPKLNVEPVQAAESPVEAPLEPENLEPPPPPLPEEGKIKLKIKLPGAAALEAAAPPTEAPPDPPSLPPFPVVVPPPPEPEVSEIVAPPPPKPGSSPRVAPPPSGPPSGGSRPAVFKRPRVPAALLAAERRKRLWKYALIAVGGIALAGAVIFGAFLKFSEPPPTPHIPPRQIAPPVVAPVVETPGPTKPVVAPKVKAAAPVESDGTRVDSTATVELTPGVMATTESIKAVPNASSAFRTFVASAKISGVYQGTPPRAFINGRLVHTGELLDDTLEIYFDSVDLAARSIVFKDSTGATVSRRY